MAKAKRFWMQPFPDDMTSRFQVLGFAVIEHALTDDDLLEIEGMFPLMAARVPGARASDFSASALARLASHDGLRQVAKTLAGVGSEVEILKLSRVLAFDKSPAANWFVPWHQDRSENGHDRTCAQLEATVALRVHLDDCDEDNGPIEFIPGSHTLGRLDASAITQLAAERSPLLCLAVRGDIVAMRPLAVHRSQRARVPRARRVLHLEYTPSR